MEKPEIIKIIQEFIIDNGLKQMILIGSEGEIKNIEIEEIP